MASRTVQRVRWRGIRWCRLGMLAFLLTCAAHPVHALGDIHWRAGIGDPERFVDRSRSDALNTIAEAALRGANRRLVVQFDRPVTSVTRADMAAAGVQLLEPLGGNAFFAAVSPDMDTAAVGRLDAFQDALPIRREWKLDPRISARDVPEWAAVAADGEGREIVAVYVLFHPDVALYDEGVIVAQRHGAEVRDDLESINGLVLELPESALDALADEDAVQWIEWPLPPMEDLNDSNRALTQANDVQSAPYELDGSDVTVLVYDGGTARATHDDFGGRLTVHDSSGLSYHATHVAGTIGGDGASSDGQYRGMAPGVTMESYGLQVSGGGIFLYTNPGDIEDDYDEAIRVHGAVIANNSIGTNVARNGFPCSITGDYGVTDNLIDTIVRGDGSNPLFTAPFLVIWANGNERGETRCGTGYATTAPPAGAKNHITVGALYSDNDEITTFSSWGPVDDGRLKPDISAPGCQRDGDHGVTSAWDTGDDDYGTICGTSMAAPTVTGVAALLIEDFRNRFPGRPLFRNSTLKAWLAHSAVDRGAVGPDYQYGYGSVRIRDAVDLMRTGAFAEAAIDQDEQFAREAQIEPGTAEFKVTLAWDDYPATPNVVPSLVNDLDLIVVDPSGGRHYPWTLDPASPAAAAVQTDEDHLNNIEQVLVNDPEPGTWTVEVYGFNVPQGPQSFSLVGHGVTTVGFSIGLPDGVPASMIPNNPLEFRVRIAATGEETVPGTPTMHYRNDGGAFTAIPLEPQGDEIYLATIPAAACSATPEFYLSAEGGETGLVRLPGTAPSEVFGVPVGELITVFADSFETTRNWSVDNSDDLTDGAWERGVPVNCDRGDPPADFDGSGQCYLTDNGTGSGCNSDVDDGWTRLTSPRLDLSDGDADVSFALWYTNNFGDNPDQDVLQVHLSTDDGLSWALIQTIGPVTSAGWSWHAVRVGDYLDPTDEVRIRFHVADADPGSVVEAGLDAFVVSRFICDDTGACDDGIRNQGEAMIDCGGPCPPCECVDDPGCDNGMYCDGTETCDAFGRCQPGDAVPCDDGVACTVDTCDDDTDSCVAVPDHGVCDNGQFCDGVEVCDAGLGCLPGEPVVCDDLISCTDDSCVEESDRCEYVPNDAFCDDGLFCNGIERCDSIDGCVAGQPVDCDDGVACTLDFCYEAVRQCLALPSDEQCDDGVFCNGVESCDPDWGCLSSGDPCPAGTRCDEESDTCDPVGDGDLDRDGDIDLADFTRFQTCFGRLTPECAAGDLAGEPGVDLEDFREFVLMLEASGPQSGQ